MGEIGAGLADFRPADRRMVIEEGPAGLTVINDTYNANPASMAAALKTLADLTKGRCGAVLGDMLELGDTAAQLHYELGTAAGHAGLDYLAVVGEFREKVAAGAAEAGMAAETARPFADKVQAAAWIRELVTKSALGAGDWLLVKGSRGLKMETVVQDLVGGK